MNALKIFADIFLSISVVMGVIMVATAFVVVINRLYMLTLTDKGKEQYHKLQNVDYTRYH
jgi:hypothetical protein